MATDKKISDLDLNPSIDGTEEIAEEKSGANFKNTFAELKDWVLTFVTTIFIQTKRPLKTINSESLEGTGNINAGGSFTLTNGNGTTANGTAVDLGGPSTGDVNILRSGLRDVLFSMTDTRFLFSSTQTGTGEFSELGIYNDFAYLDVIDEANKLLSIDLASSNEVITLYNNYGNGIKFDSINDYINVNWATDDLVLPTIDLVKANTVQHTTTGEPTGSDPVLNMVSLTQAEYDAGTPVATTMYLITDA